MKETPRRLCPALFPLKSPNETRGKVLELRTWFCLDLNHKLSKQFAKIRPERTHPWIASRTLVRLQDDGVREPLVPPLDGVEIFGFCQVKKILKNIRLPKKTTTHNKAVWRFLKTLKPKTCVVLKWH